MGELDGKVAIVTGAGRLRGIGRTSALHLAKLGADVVVTGTGRDPDSYPPDEKAVGWRDVESTADQIRDQGRRALTLTVDVTDRGQVQRMVDSALAEFGRVDILINNAAYPIGADRVPILDLDPDIFNKVMDIKVTGTFLCTKASIKPMIDQGEGGKIVNISSTMGKRGMANALAYSAANFAAIGMTQSMAKELGPHGINVNAVCPGAVDTHRMDLHGREEHWQQLASNAPIGRTGTDDEVGAFCAYLCTKAASWIHGQSININGGTVMEH
ncbi:MAG: SDR family oxidoreductase [Chloroflexi bacterium]|nr:SDR family oxidoreductase [Chloroflexota bacterium]